MSSASGPSIATSGLVLDFDAANLKSFGPPTVEVLVVAGGGGGGLGSNVGAGGGAGGLIYNSAFLVTAGTAVTVTVGAGGAKGASGSNSVFSSLTAIGGGYGGAESPALSGAAGGSGGGQCYNGGTIGAGTAGQGNNGGAAGVAGTGYPAGGGGGASAVGGAGVNSVRAGAGGLGRLFDISGALTYYAGGGGGGAWVGVSTYAPGGLGGGGAGSFNGQTTFISPDGTPNTGGGGGGGFTTGNSNTAGGSGAGGSGVVIIRYPGLQKATGGTITNVGGYTVHTFTTTGSSTFTPGTNWADGSATNVIAALQNASSNTVTASANYVTFAPPDMVSAAGYYLINDEKIAALYTQLTIECWFYVTTFYASAARPMSPRITESQSPIGFSVSAGGISCELNTAPTGWQTSSASSSACAANVWICVHQTTDDSNKLFKTYVNGVQVISLTYTGTPNTSGGILLGRGFYGGNVNFAGRISNAKVYNRALSATEVAQNFNATRSRYGL